jgi:hypothetical protein
LRKSEIDPELQTVPRTAPRPVRTCCLFPTTRRTLLRGLGASVALPFLPLGLLEARGDTPFSNLAPQLLPTVPQPVPTAVQTVAAATLSTAAVGAIPDYFMGLSYEKGDFVTESLFTGAQTSLAGLLNRLGNGVLRIGGNSADTTVWTPGGPGNTAGQVSPVDVDNLAEFLALTNWKLLYTLNLGTSTPALAAAEAAYVQAHLGSFLVGFEIGNEPDEYGLSYFPTGWDLAAFESLWQQFCSAILASTPSAVITGPATSGNVTTWTVPFFLGPNGKFLSLLTQHYYRGNGHNVNATVANLVSPDPTIVADCTALRSATAGSKIPFRISETNSYLFGGSPGVSDAYASSLWVVDHLFNIAYGGGSGVNMQGGDDSFYTPIVNDGSTIIEPAPEYYGLLLFSLAGQGDLLKTTFSVANFNATIYAVRAPSGGINVVIVNKEAFQSLNITINCGRGINGAQLIVLEGPSLSATTGENLQGATVASDGSIVLTAPLTAYAPANISSSFVRCYVPAISAVLLQIV